MDGPNTVNYDCHMAGFIDSHCHPLFAGRELQGAILKDCSTVAELIKKIQEFHSANNLPWFDLSSVEANFPINRFVLDRAVSDVPLVVHTADHHSICVNSKALEVAGFLNRTPEVAGGRFDLENGVPNGWIHEYVAMQLIYQHQPKPTLPEDLNSLRLAQQKLQEFGIIEVTDAWIDPGMTEVYLEAAARGELLVKTNLCFRITPEDSANLLSYAIEMRSRVTQLASDLLTADRIKLFVDGVFSSGTAWLKSDETTSGIWKSAELLSVASRASQSGFRLHFHACGDRAVKEAIEVIRETRAQGSVIAHVDLIDEADIPDLSSLDITVNSTPLWAKESPAEHYNYRGLLDAGVKLAFGSDWPVSEPDPVANLEAAVQFRNLTRAEAIAAAQMLV